MVFVQVALTVFTTANLVLAIHRLVMHVRAEGCHRRLPQICLELIIIGNICTYQKGANDDLSLWKLKSAIKGFCCIALMTEIEEALRMRNKY